MNTLPTLAIIGPGKVGTSMGILAAHTGTFGIQNVSSLLFVSLNSESQIATDELPKNSIKKAMNEILNITEN